MKITKISLTKRRAIKLSICSFSFFFVRKSFQCVSAIHLTSLQFYFRRKMELWKNIEIPKIKFSKPLAPVFQTDVNFTTNRTGMIKLVFIKLVTGTGTKDIFINAKFSKKLRNWDAHNREKALRNENFVFHLSSNSPEYLALAPLISAPGGSGQTSERPVPLKVTWRQNQNLWIRVFGVEHLLTPVYYYFLLYRTRKKRLWNPERNWKRCGDEK